MVFARVISLEKRKDRLAAFRQEAMYTDVASIWSVTPAVDGRKLDLSTVPMVAEARMTLHSQIISGKRLAHRDLSPGAVGCYLSHMKVWKALVESGEPFGIVFEDDVSFDRQDVVQQVLRDIAEAPVDWDILVYLPDYFSYHYVPLEGYQHVLRWFGLHFYVIRAEACNLISPAMLPMSQQIDSELSDMAQAGDIKVYRPMSMKPKQGNSYGTDIQVKMR